MSSPLKFPVPPTTPKPSQVGAVIRLVLIILGLVTSAAASLFAVGFVLSVIWHLAAWGWHIGAMIIP